MGFRKFLWTFKLINCCETHKCITLTYYNSLRFKFCNEIKVFHPELPKGQYYYTTKLSSAWRKMEIENKKTLFNISINTSFIVNVYIYIY